MPTVQCNGCGSSNTTLKYISCLHTLCVPCVQNNIDFDGSIKCPQCFSSTQLPVGVEPLRSMPSVAVPGNLGSVAGNDECGAKSACEECGDDTPATSSCENCHAKMCKIHAAGHPLSKTSKGHIVKPIDEVSTSSTTCILRGSTMRGAAQHRPRCAVHASDILDRFCVQCNQVLCPRCKLPPSHKQDHQVLDIPSAGQMSRDKLSEKLASCTSESEGVLNKAMRNVSKNIEALNEQTECASAKVTGFIKEEIERLKKREADLLTQLDAMRSKKLIPLEKQLNRLQECVAQVEGAGLILQSGSDDVDLLRMFPWIDGTLDKAMKTTEVEGEPCTAGGIVFASTDTTDLQNGIEKCGAVLDVVDCAVLDCPDKVTTHDDVVLHLRPDASSADTATAASCIPPPVMAVSQAQLDNIAVRVTVKSCDDEDMCSLDTLCESLPGRVQIDQGSLPAGHYTVAATVAGWHLEGSPHGLLVMTKPVFDAARCSSQLVIEGSGASVKCVTSAEYHASVCTTPITMQTDRTTQKVRIDRTGNGSILLSACSSSAPKLDTHQQDNSQCYGWYGYCSIPIHTGTALGQPWHTGDVIQLTVDHDHHTLTGYHERTGVTETIQNVTGDLYWMVSLCRIEDQVTLL